MSTYSYKGVGRNKTLTITAVSSSDEETVLGTYDLLASFTWDGVTYPLLATDTALAQLSSVDYNKRLNAFVAYVKNDLVSYPQLASYNLLGGAVEGTDTFGTVA